MSTFKNASNLQKELQDYQHVLPRLREAILRNGGIIREDIFPTVEEMKQVIVTPKHRLFEKYFGTSDIVKVFNIVAEPGREHELSEEAKEFISNWRSSRSRQLSDNPIQEVRTWGVDYDPVSKLLVIADIAITADNASFDYSTEDAKWLNHNKDYYSKIGFTSQYHPDLLIKAGKGYESTDHISITDDEIEKLSLAIVELQQLVKGMRIEPMRLEDVHEEALERNNKAAESAPGFRNQKHDSVREEVLRDAYFIKENCDYTDLQLINEQRRIQSGGNVLFKDYYPLKFSADGKIMFSLEAVAMAVERIKSERGVFTYYSPDAVETLPVISHLVTCEPLPESEHERVALVEQGAPERILFRDKKSGNWLLKYIVTAPNVFTLVKDISPEFEELQNEIYTKHRSIKAAMSSHSRVGQSYLYPFMNTMKANHLKLGDPYFSMVAQWSHPDDIKMFITDILVASVPELFEGHGVSVSYSDAKLKKFNDTVNKHLFNRLVSSDDKAGFDTRTKYYTTWAFYTCFFALPFTSTPENDRLLKMFAMNDLFSFVCTVEGLTLYSGIIGSGQFTTSIGGTYRSNVQSLTNRMLFADDKITTYLIEEKETDIDNEDATGSFIEIGGEL